MDDEIIFLVLSIIALTGGVFLIFMKMMLGYKRDRRAGAEASFGQRELEALIERAIDSRIAPLQDTLGIVEEGLHQLRDVAEARTLTSAGGSGGVTPK